MPISPTSPARTGRRLLAALALAATAALFLLTAHAKAAEGSQYGEVATGPDGARFGGFDTTWFDDGAYDGKGATPNETEPKPGLFLNTTGFAVDTQDKTPGGDGTAVYVLDRVSAAALKTSESGTRWRLQKLIQEPDGALEAAARTEFFLPKTGEQAAGFRGPVWAVGLAVDPSEERIYTVIFGTKPASGSVAARPYAEEVLGWSTVQSGDVLEPAGGTPDTVSTPVTTAGGVTYSVPSVFVDEAELAKTPVYDPQGLALDATDGKDDLAIIGDSGSLEGPAIVEQVSPATGEETGSWTAAQLAGAANATSGDETALAEGISTNPDGSLNVLLRAETLSSSSNHRVDVVNLPANLSDPTVIYSEDIQSPSGSGASAYDQSVYIDTGEGHGGDVPLGSATGIELSDGLYAADYGGGEGTLGAGYRYWESGVSEGIRLVTPTAQGLLANPLLPPSFVFDTLGNPTTGGTCHIGTAVGGANENVSLAAGADDTIWMLTAGVESGAYKSGSDEKYVTGRQVVEFAPGEGTPCAGPSGTFTVTDTSTAGATPQPASPTTPLTVSEGSTVEFDAAPIAYPAGGESAAIYAYQWDPTGAPGAYTTVEDGDTSTSPVPPQTESYQYKTPGTYDAQLKVFGDFGEYDESAEIVVKEVKPPSASFTATSSGLTASFDASASTPAEGGSIADYQWSFGDGQSDETQGPSDTHAYAASGEYTVTLTVIDGDGRQSIPFKEQITVTGPPAQGGGTTGGENTGSGGGGGAPTQTGGGGGPTTTTTATTTTTTTTTQTTHTNTVATKKVQTTAQKLAAALKQCKKDKSKSKRKSCETTAKKKYAAKAKKKKKSKKKKTKSKAKKK